MTGCCLELHRPAFRAAARAGGVVIRLGVSEDIFGSVPGMAPLDATDIRILRTMGIQPYGRAARSPDQLKPFFIARTLGMRRELVKERVRALEAQGVIGGYEIFPNYRHLGLEAACYYYRFRGKECPPGIAEKLQVVDGVAAVYLFHGGVMCVILWSRSPMDLQRKLTLITSLSGAGEPQKFYDLEMPVVHRPLGALDLRIIRALRGNAKRPISEVAKQLGVSAKTAKRRFEAMAKEGSFFVIPLVDPSQAEGMILFGLLLRIKAEAPPDIIGAIHRALDRSLVGADAPSTLALANHSVLLVAKNTAEVRDLRRRVEGLAGVAGAEAFFFEGASESFAWIDEALDAMIGRSGRIV